MLTSLADWIYLATLVVSFGIGWTVASIWNDTL